MEIPAPDPNKLLLSWMEWERGEVTPGRVMANLKTGGMRELLEDLLATTSIASARPRGQSGDLAVSSAEHVTAGAVGGAGEEASEPSPPNDPLGGQPAWAPVV